MKRLLLAFLFALPAFAQSPHIDGGKILVNNNANWDQKAASYTFTFKPLPSPCMMTVSAAYNITGTFTDSQGDAFSLVAGSSGDQLWVSKTCQPGAHTITVSCSGGTPCWAEYIFEAYSGSWVVDQVSPEVDNVVSATGWTAPIAVNVGELVLGIGSNHIVGLPGLTATGGFTLRDYGNAFLEDMVATVAGPISSAVTYSSVVNWCQITVSFKLATPPTYSCNFSTHVCTLNGFGNFYFPMAAPPDCTDGTCSAVACNTTLQPNVCVTLLPGQSGYLVIQKPGNAVTVTIASP